METMSEKLGARGGNMGSPFDDGVFDGVRKIVVGKDFDCVSYIKIEYQKDGKFESREHGTIRGGLKEFTVDYPDEYITSVRGRYENVYRYGAVLIKSLIFKTSKGRTSPTLGHTTLYPSGTEFMFESKNGGKLLGFHGRAGQALDAIGPHFLAVNSPLKHFSPQGGNGGNAWDDGAFDGVRKILVGRSGKYVSYVRFEYAKGERTVSHAHGKKQEVPQEFVVDYPNEHITSVEGTIDGYVSSLKFKTSKGRTSPAFGNVVGRKFVFEEKGFKLVGFCGRSGDVIDAIGAHFAPLPPPTPAPAPAPATTKMGPLGGNKGDTFEDGVFDGVKKITIGADQYSITYIKIEYEKDRRVEIREHGTNRGELNEFSVAYPNDYITAVGGSYEHTYNYDTTLIKSLYFTTSKGFTSPMFGEMKGTEFEFKGENGGKLLGFHGRAGYAIDALGVYFSRSATPMLRGKWIQVEQKGKGPGPRCSHAIAMVGEKMYSFGGELKPNFHIDRDLYVFDFKTRTWSLAPANGDVPELPCLGVCMVSIGTTLYVFGGRDGNRNYNGCHSYDTVKSEWKLITHVEKGPAPRSFHAMAADDKNVYVFGGVSKSVRVNTLHAYNIVHQKWFELPNPGESCDARGGLGLAVVQGKIWVVYGFNGDEMNDVHCFDPVQSKWTKVETRGEKPSARSVFATAVVGKYIIISGGEIEMDPKAHLGPGKLDGGAFVLDTESLLWEKLEEGHSPRGWCASTTASIEGKKGLLMFGGKAQTNGRYDDIFFYGVDSA